MREFVLINTVDHTPEPPTAVVTTTPATTPMVSSTPTASSVWTLRKPLFRPLLMMRFPSTALIICPYYELIYYINDVKIDNKEVLVEYGAAHVPQGKMPKRKLLKLMSVKPMI